MSGRANGSPFTLAGLVNGRAYTFTVTAVNNVGFSPASDVTNAVTPSGNSPSPPLMGDAWAGNGAAR
jgi:hypothetical protein